MRCAPRANHYLFDDLSRGASFVDMEERPNQEKKTLVPTVSEVLEDGSIIELIYRPEDRVTLLALFNAGRWTLQRHVDVTDGDRFVPFSPNNNLIKNEVVLLPSA